jgi:hypothetical protein
MRIFEKRGLTVLKFGPNKGAVQNQKTVSNVCDDDNSLQSNKIPRFLSLDFCGWSSHITH